jgi:hypothetical protein
MTCERRYHLAPLGACAFAFWQTGGYYTRFFGDIQGKKDKKELTAELAEAAEGLNPKSESLRLGTPHGGNPRQIQIFKIRNIKQKIATKKPGAA